MCVVRIFHFILYYFTFLAFSLVVFNADGSASVASLVGQCRALERGQNTAPQRISLCSSQLVHGTRVWKGCLYRGGTLPTLFLSQSVTLTFSVSLSLTPSVLLFLSFSFPHFLSFSFCLALPFPLSLSPSISSLPFSYSPYSLFLCPSILLPIFLSLSLFSPWCLSLSLSRSLFLLCKQRAALIGSQ